MDDLATASAVELARSVREGQASPVDVLQAVLTRIDAWEPHLSAFVARDRADAQAQAQAAERAVTAGEDLGPLHGVPVTIKNNQAVAGYPTLRGSRLSVTTPASADAPLVARLREAGAVIVGVTTMPEHGWTAVSDSPLTGSTHNPWRHGFTSGGSSAGAAALAGSGCGPLHVGTDGAGSIRLPAHFCGAVGFKPTFGTVPYVPMPNNGSLSHAGPLTRSVADAALMTSVMAGPHPTDHTTLPGSFPATVPTGDLTGLRIAYSRDLGHARVDDDVAAVVDRAVAVLREAGAVVEELDPPWGPEGPALERLLWGVAYAGYRPGDATEVEQMDPGLVACTEEFAELRLADAVDAQRSRIAYAASVNSWFADAGWDVLVTPSASVAAFEVGRQRPSHWPQHAWDWLVWAEFSYPFNLSHGPAVSVPCGFTSTGLPVGLQVAGPRLADATVLQVAAAFLDRRPFTRLPALPTS